MPRAGPRTVRTYSEQFKLTAVQLSQQPGIQVKTGLRPHVMGRSCR
jgi:transposase-like protein